MADNDGGFTLDENEKEEIRKKVAETKPEDEDEVRAKFEAKYGKVGEVLMNSKLSAVRGLALNVVALWEMLTDPDYALDWKVKAGIITALGYFISPVDAIPDVIPVVGYVDDALVVAYVVHLLSEDISKYRAWRKSVGRPMPEA